MRKTSILFFSLLSCSSTLCFAAQNRDSFHSNAGVTVISNDDSNENAYFYEIGYQHQLDSLFSIDASYKKVETFTSSVGDNSDDFVQSYDAYSLGIQVGQHQGYLSLYGKAGVSLISSETQTWDGTSSTVLVDEDDAIKPYASIGASIASPYEQGLTFDVAVNYQMLANDQHSTSVSGGVNFAF